MSDPTIPSPPPTGPGPDQTGPLPADSLAAGPPPAAEPPAPAREAWYRRPLGIVGLTVAAAVVALGLFGSGVVVGHAIGEDRGDRLVRQEAGPGGGAYGGRGPQGFDHPGPGLPGPGQGPGQDGGQQWTPPDRGQAPLPSPSTSPST